MKAKVYSFKCSFVWLLSRFHGCNLLSQCGTEAPRTDGSASNTHRVAFSPSFPLQLSLPPIPPTRPRGGRKYELNISLLESTKKLFEDGLSNECFVLIGEQSRTGKCEMISSKWCTNNLKKIAVQQRHLTPKPNLRCFKTTFICSMHFLFFEWLLDTLMHTRGSWNAYRSRYTVCMTPRYGILKRDFAWPETDVRSHSKSTHSNESTLVKNIMMFKGSFLKEVYDTGWLLVTKQHKQPHNRAKTSLITHVFLGIHGSIDMLVRRSNIITRYWIFTRIVQHHEGLLPLLHCHPRERIEDCSNRVSYKAHWRPWLFPSLQASDIEESIWYSLCVRRINHMQLFIFRWLERKGMVQ